MAQTFDIRFSRSTGLAALFEAPGNRFGWKGAGLLSIDADGVQIVARRGLPMLFARNLTRRFTAHEVAGVYREADAVRLEYGGGQSARAALPFWARDAAAAAEIVKLLPTRESVEMEHSTPATRGYRIDWRLVAPLAVVLAMGVGLPLWRGASTPAEEPASASIPAAAGIESGVAGSALDPTSASESGIESSEIRADGEASSRPSRMVAGDSAVAASGRDGAADPSRATSKTPDGQTTADPSLSVESETLTYKVAPYEDATFLADLTALRAAYLRLGDARDAAAFRTLEERWWQISVRIYLRSGSSAQSSLELAISRSWRMLLATRAEAVARGDPEVPESVATELAFADRLAAQLTTVHRLTP
jgi:hypothetical protein